MLMIPRHFRQTVTTAGTRVRLTTAHLSTPVMDIQSESTNTGRIYVGDSQVSSTNCMADLGPVDSLSLVAANYGGTHWDMNDLWIDASTSTDGGFVGWPLRKEGEKWPTPAGV